VKYETMIRVWLVLLIFSMLACGQVKNECAFCKREIHRGMMAITEVNGDEAKACCASCAMTFQNEHKEASLKRVTDFTSDTGLDPSKAIFVYGSTYDACSAGQDVVRDVHSTYFTCYDRCSPSIVAFAKRADAESFQRKQGGRIVALAEVVKQHSPGKKHTH